MKTSYILVLLALIVPLAVCYPQPLDDADEDSEQMYEEALAESGQNACIFIYLESIINARYAFFLQDDDDSKLEGMLRMIQQTGGEEEDEEGEEENGLIMQSEDEEEDDEPDIQSRKHYSRSQNTM